MKKQRTLKGAEIPIPKRSDFLRDLLNIELFFFLSVGRRAGHRAGRVTWRPSS
jgi:hypothetical protein